jgi:hypothetical protein
MSDALTSPAASMVRASGQRATCERTRSIPRRDRRLGSRCHKARFSDLFGYVWGLEMGGNVMVRLPSGTGVRRAETRFEIPVPE